MLSRRRFLAAGATLLGSLGLARNTNAAERITFEHHLVDYADKQPIACGGPARSGIVLDYIYSNQPAGTIVRNFTVVVSLDGRELWKEPVDVVVGPDGFVTRVWQSLKSAAGVYQFEAGVPNGLRASCSVVSPGPE
jgi:hypothetical protein